MACMCRYSIARYNTHMFAMRFAVAKNKIQRYRNICEQDNQIIYLTYIVSRQCVCQLANQVDSVFSCIHISCRVIIVIVTPHRGDAVLFFVVGHSPNCIKCTGGTYQLDHEILTIMERF